MLACTDMQERILAEHSGNWRQDYFMPAQADRFVRCHMASPGPRCRPCPCRVQDTPGKSL